MKWGFGTQNLNLGAPRRSNDGALHSGEASWRHFHEAHHQEDLASSLRGQIDRLMKFAASDEHSDHTGQGVH